MTTDTAEILRLAAEKALDDRDEEVKVRRNSANRAGQREPYARARARAATACEF